MRFVMAALAAVLLGACSPEYNWREVRAADQGYVVMLPGKPASMTRTIQLDGLEVPMTMQGAKVGDTSFTVASALLPDGSEATRARAVAAMRAGMLRNIAGTEKRAQPVRVQVIDAGGAATGEAAALRVDAEGSAQGKPVTMLAGFTAHANRAYQWLALGPAVDAEQAGTFLSSFRLTLVAP